jgi:hypothetical protein
MFHQLITLWKKEDVPDQGAIGTPRVGMQRFTARFCACPKTRRCCDAEPDTSSRQFLTLCVETPEKRVM